MFFFFSKLAYLFIPPANWIIALLVWRLFAKSYVVKRRLAITIIVLFFLFGNKFIYTRLALAWQPVQVQLPQNSIYNAGIVLGGLTSFDKNGNGFLNAASDRLTETAILYKTGKIKKVILSGGSVAEDRPKEAPFLFRKITELGVAPGDVLTEDQSRTTFENAVFSKRIVDSLKLAPPFLLITSAMHVRRAKRVFDKAGLPVIAFPCDYHVLDIRFNLDDYLIPSLTTLNDWSMLMKEIVGLAGYTVFKKA